MTWWSCSNQHKMHKTLMVPNAHHRSVSYSLYLSLYLSAYLSIYLHICLSVFLQNVIIVIYRRIDSRTDNDFSISESETITISILTDMILKKFLFKRFLMINNAKYCTVYHFLTYTTKNFTNTCR